MKKLITFTFMLLASTGMLLASNGEPKTINLDNTNATISWKGYKIGGSHEGNVGLASGDIQMTDGALSGGNFVIDMASISCTDMEGEYADKLVGHLASDDFFGVASYPTAKLDITKVVSRGVAGEYKVIADLTIKDKTNPVKFNVFTNEAGEMTANITIDRSEYDVRYGSGSFFDNLGDNTIYDEFEISVTLSAGE